MSTMLLPYTAAPFEPWDRCIVALCSPFTDPLKSTLIRVVQTKQKLEDVHQQTHYLREILSDTKWLFIYDGTEMEAHCIALVWASSKSMISFKLGPATVSQLKTLHEKEVSNFMSCNGISISGNQIHLHAIQAKFFESINATINFTGMDIVYDILSRLETVIQEKEKKRLPNGPAQLPTECITNKILELFNPLSRQAPLRACNSPITELIWPSQIRDYQDMESAGPKFKWRGFPSPAALLDQSSFYYWHY